jgi:hypothetical protein
MGASAFRREDCRLCGSRDVELVFQLAPTPVGDHYVSADKVGQLQETFPLDLFLCRGCGHLQLLDVVDPEVLFGDYTYVTSISLGLVEHFRKYADEILARLGLGGNAFVVEIGSNDGSLLRAFQHRGLRVLGVDPAREIARQATDSGVETLPTFFTSELARTIRRERGPAALIAANNVFAHADNLGDMADGIRELLAPDGVFAFEVSYLIDFMDNMVFDSIYHEHLCYHSVKPLDTFFRRHGLELIGADHVATKGGSLRCTVQPAGGPRPVSESVARLIALEERLGLAKTATFHAFAAKIDRVRAQVLEQLGGLVARGKAIAGYGASVTVTTLVHHFGLGKLLSFLVDDNSSRHHLFSPGHHIPVLPPQVLYERNPDCVVILAWRYADPIIKKHQGFLNRGGRFLVPLPEVRLVKADAISGDSSHALSQDRLGRVA